MEEEFLGKEIESKFHEFPRYRKTKLLGRPLVRVEGNRWALVRNTEWKGLRFRVKERAIYEMIPCQ